MSLVNVIEAGQEPPELIRSIVKLGFAGDDVEEFETFASHCASQCTSKYEQSGITFYSLNIDDVETLKDVAISSVFLFYVDNEKVDHVQGWDEDEMHRLVKLYFSDEREILESEDIEPFECSHQNCFCDIDMSKVKFG